MTNWKTVLSAFAIGVAYLIIFTVGASMILRKDFEIERLNKVPHKHYFISNKDTSDVYQVNATIYYPTGNTTFSGSVVPKDYTYAGYHWIAISHDLTQHFSMNDTVVIWGDNTPFRGLAIVKDLMHNKHTTKLDMLVRQGEYAGVWKTMYIKKFNAKLLYTTRRDSS